MARKPKILTRLVVNEISSVDRGAGEGVRVVLMKRTPRNRFEKMFRQIDFSKVKTTPLEVEGDDSEKLPGAMELYVNALRVANPSLSREAAVRYLLHGVHGRATARHLSETFKAKEPPPMDRNTQLQSIVKSHGGVQAMAKLFVIDNDAHGISEHELTALAFEEAKKSAKPGERPNSAFARWFQEPEQLELRKAIDVSKRTLVSKAAAQLLDLQPTQVGGEDATDVNTDTSEAYAQLQTMANELRRRSPELTVAQAFARVFEDTANAELAARAHRRPQAGEGYAMPT